MNSNFHGDLIAKKKTKRNDEKQKEINQLRNDGKIVKMGKIHNGYRPLKLADGEFF